MAATHMRPEQRELAAAVGISVFLASWAMVFISLLFAHELLSARSTEETPALPVALAAANTMVLVLSSGLARLRRPRLAAGLAAVAGLGFVALQSLLWWELVVRGVLPTETRTASSIYALTGFHAVHVLVGIGGLFWVAARRPQGLLWWRWYWDFVTVAWLAIFLLAFVF